MKYLLDLDSPNFNVLLEAAKHEITRAKIVHTDMKRRWGAGHSLTVAAGTRVRAAELCVVALIVAQQNAEPEHASPASQADAVPAYFEEDLPRPVPPRSKASNLRRRYSKGAC